jgi:hypothetical protein
MSSTCSRQKGVLQWIPAIVSSISQAFSIVGGSPAATTLSVVGLALLLLCAGLAYVALKTDAQHTSTLLKTSLFLSLVGGMLFSAAGPGLALLRVSSPIGKVSLDQSFENLERNDQVKWLIRLIPFDPHTDANLKAGKLDRLGPPKQYYTFVANYEELVGYTAKAALEMTGTTYDPSQHISAVIFRLHAG